MKNRETFLLLPFTEARELMGLYPNPDDEQVADWARVIGEDPTDLLEAVQYLMS